MARFTIKEYLDGIKKIQEAKLKLLNDKGRINWKPEDAVMYAKCLGKLELINNMLWVFEEELKEKHKEAGIEYVEDTINNL